MTSMLKKRGMGQSWSFDIILAFVVFILIIAIFYAMINANTKTSQPETLQREASVIANSLDNATGIKSSLSVIDKGKVEGTNVQNLYESDYNTLKTQFGIKGEFCIYIIDQNGNLITVNTSTGRKVGFGNDDLMINGIPCGSTVG